MRTSKLPFNSIVIPAPVVAASGVLTLVERAGNDKDVLWADPRLLQIVADNLDTTFMVSVQRELKGRAIKEHDPEIAVPTGGGGVKDRLNLIVSFSAEMSSSR